MFRNFQKKPDVRNLNFDEILAKREGEKVSGPVTERDRRASQIITSQKFESDVFQKLNTTRIVDLKANQRDKKEHEMKKYLSIKK